MLAPQGPTSPPANQVWRLDPVAGADGVYTIRSVYQKPRAPSYLAYSLNCAKNEPFMAAGPAPGIGQRWDMTEPDDTVQIFSTIGRTCGIRYQIARFSAGTNTSCAATAAKQRTLKLIRSVAEPQGGWITWRQKLYVPYPAKLQGDITAGSGWETERGQNLLGSFGGTVAMSKTAIVVGGQAPGPYVFAKNRAGAWTRQALPPPPKGKNENYETAWESHPYTTSVSTDLVAVGVPWYLRKAGSKLKLPGNALLYSLADVDARPVKVPTPRGAEKEFGQAVQLSDAFLAVGDGRKIFIWALTPGKPKKLASAAPQTTLSVGPGTFLLSGSTLAVDVANTTIIYEYDRTTKSWPQRAKINLNAANALTTDALVFSQPGKTIETPDGPKLNESYVKMSMYNRNSDGTWVLAQEIEDGWVETNRDTWTSFSAPALDAATLVIGSTTHWSMEQRTGIFAYHRIFIYTKSGPGGAWARAATFERMDIASNLGSGAKAVVGDVIACGGTVLVQDDVQDGSQGAVLLLSKKRELAAAAASGGA